MTVELLQLQKIFRRLGIVLLGEGVEEMIGDLVPAVMVLDEIGRNGIKISSDTLFPDLFPVLPEFQKNILDEIFGHLDAPRPVIEEVPDVIVVFVEYFFERTGVHTGAFK
jgi:hypothetical protein